MDQAILDKDNIAISAGYITVFNFHAQTREYLSSSVEFLAEGVGIPANACVDSPAGAQTGSAICRAKTLTGWEYVADHRGEQVYSTVNGEAVTIMALGQYPPNTTRLSPTSSFDQWDGQQWVTDSDAQKADAVTLAENEKRRLQSAAAEIISPLNTAVKYEMVTDDEKAKLARWEKYTVLLSRVDTSLAPDIEWPPIPA